LVAAFIGILHLGKRNNLEKKIALRVCNYLKNVNNISTKKRKSK